MGELLQPRRKWKRVRGGLNTIMRRCPDCYLLMLEGDIWEHEKFHYWLDDLAGLVNARQLNPGEEQIEGVSIEGCARPLADRVPVAYNWGGGPRREPGAIARAFADAWRAVFPGRPPAVMPPSSIPASLPGPGEPAPVPVPSYVADQARRQVQRATQPREQPR